MEGAAVVAVFPVRCGLPVALRFTSAGLPGAREELRNPSTDYPTLQESLQSQGLRVWTFLSPADGFVCPCSEYIKTLTPEGVCKITLKSKDLEMSEIPVSSMFCYILQGWNFAEATLR